MSTQKFRPVLSPKEIEHIVLLCKREQPAPSSASMKLLTKLAPMLTKIEIGAVKPAYTLTEHADLLTTLGGIAAAPSPSYKAPALLVEQAEKGTIHSSAYSTKEEYWEACYQKFSMNPTACSLAELLASDEWRYLHELMTEEEARAFEARMI